MSPEVNSQDWQPETEPLVEVATAKDRLEALIWLRALEEAGIKVSTVTPRNILRAILYLGRTPVKLMASAADAPLALAELKKYRFV